MMRYRFFSSFVFRDHMDTEGERAMAMAMSSHARAFVLCVVLLLLVHEVSCLSPDETALQEMAELLKGDGGGRRWMTNGSDPCSWMEVVCDPANRVTELLLSSLDLRGSIPSSVGKLQNLTLLDLSMNLLSGPIPPSISSCSGLSTLNLSFNHLSGSIPQSLQHLLKLSVLDLSYNGFIDRVPQGLGSLQSLRHLDLSSNNLTGSIPPDFVHLSSIANLSLSQNLLSGKIPDFVAELSNLTRFSAYQNELEGEIPQQLGAQTNSLQWVNLASNRLNGSIPKNICASRGLQVLILTNNSLNGTLPEDLGSCTSLSTLRVGFNQLTGSIPVQFGQLANLTYFEADRNNLVGEIPSDVRGWNSLSLLNLARNRLTGSIPVELSNVSTLQELHLSQNHLTGEIPDGLSSCKYLSLLDLSENNLNGSVPLDLCQAPKLEYLLLHGNHISGRIPDTIGDCAELLKLELGNNRLIGSIPPTIGKLSNLQISLNLSLNALTGSIPFTLGNLGKLVSLDLSHNQLSGDIPSSLTNMVSLIDWDFSSNLLTGPVPHSGPFSNSSFASFSNNAGLCGSPLSPCMSNSSYIPRKRNSPFWLSAGIAVACAFVVLVITVGLAVRAMYKHQASSAVDPIPSRMMSHIFVESYRQATNFESIKEATLSTANVVSSNHFSTIYRAVMPSGLVLAAKKLHSAEKGVAVHQRKMILELDKLANLSHDNVMRPVGYVLQNDSVILLYDFIPWCSIGQQLHSDLESTLDWSIRYTIALGAAQGLAFLHYSCHPPVIHLDVTSNNIFLSSNLEVQVGDIEVAKLLDPSKHTGSISAVAGSFGYIAPEYAFTMRVTMASNVYSFGVVLLELVTGRRPIDEAFGEGVDLVRWVHGAPSRSETPEQILDDRISTTSFSSRQEMLEVLKVALLCTNASPSRRPRMKKVAEMILDAKHSSVVQFAPS